MVGTFDRAWDRCFFEADEAYDGAVGILGCSYSVVGSSSCRAAFWTRRGSFTDFLAVWAVFNDEADGFFDSYPVKLLGDGGGGFVDPAMCLGVYLSRDLVLSLWVSYNLFILQHQSLILTPVLRWKQLIVRRSAPQTAFLRPISAIRVLSVFEIESDLVEAFFRDKVFAFWTEVATINNSIYELVRMGAEISAAFDTSDALETQGIPYSA